MSAGLEGGATTANRRSQLRAQLCVISKPSDIQNIIQTRLTPAGCTNKYAGRASTVDRKWAATTPQQTTRVTVLFGS
jgi:hypothetical protein